MALSVSSTSATPPRQVFKPAALEVGEFLERLSLLRAALESGAGEGTTLADTLRELLELGIRSPGVAAVLQQLHVTAADIALIEDRGAVRDCLAHLIPGFELWIAHGRDPAAAARGLARLREARGGSLFVPIDTVPRGGEEGFGEKAVRLMRMRGMGLNVPPAVVIDSTAVRGHLLVESPDLDLLRAEAGRIVGVIGSDQKTRAAGLRFGDLRNPLLVSVRAGAAQRMAGILPTLLRVGFLRPMIAGLAERFNDPIGAHRAFYRYLLDFGELIGRVPRDRLSALGEPSEELTALWGQIDAATALYGEVAGSPFPEDPIEQLVLAMIAVARGWNAPHVQRYRLYRGLPDDPPAPIIIQRMVHGDLGRGSFAGFVQTRDPLDGERGLYGQFRRGSGDRVMSEGARGRRFDDLRLLDSSFAQELGRTREALETVFEAPQGFELTVERGVRYLLQTTDFVGAPFAMLRAALELYEAGVITARRLRGLVGRRIFEAVGRASFRPPPPEEVLDRTLLTGETAVMGIGAGPAHLLDYRTAKPDLSTAPYGPVFFIAGTPPSEVWGQLLRDAVAIVFLNPPPAHLVQRASEKALRARQGLAILASPDETLEISAEGLRIRIGDRTHSLRPRDIVSVDASHARAYVATGRLEEEPRGVTPLVRYLSETDRTDPDEVARLQAQIQGRQAGLRARYLVRYDAAIRALEEEESRQTIDEVATELLAAQGLEWPEVRDAILRRRWGVEGWDSVEEQATYQFDDRVSQLLAHLIAAPDHFLADLFLTTTHTEHSLAVGLFRMIPGGAQAAFLNSYAARAVTRGIRPGGPAGIFLISRMISSYWRRPEEGAQLITSLDLPSIRFLLRDLQAFYDLWEHPRGTGDLQAAGGIVSRFPGMTVRNMGEIFRQLPPEVSARILADPELEGPVRARFVALTKTP